MIDNMSMQQRVILATILSFLFFLGYSYFIPTPNQVVGKNESNTTKKENLAPATTTKATASKELDSNNTDVKKSINVGNNIIATIEAEKFRIKIDDLGRVKQFKLKEKKHFDEDKGNLGNLFDDNNPLRALEIRFSDDAINEEAFKTPYTSNTKEIDLSKDNILILTQKLSNLTVTKRIKFNKDGSYSLDVKLSESIDYFITPGFRPNVAVDAYTVHGALLRKTDGKLEIIEDGDAKGNERFVDIEVAASSDRYYTTAFYKFDSQKTSNSIDSTSGLSIFISKNKDDDAFIFIKGDKSFNTNGYIGPKDYNVLSNIDKKLTDIIEYGFFTWIAKPVFLLLKWLYGIFGNWGWAIVATTILIRLVLYPLTYKGMVSMNKLKEIAPQIKELQTKYKSDPQKMQSHMMQLYKKHGANPMGGCLPMLLQIPVFFAIYRVLLNAVELKSAEWILWINDLSVLDPYFVLPILMGATMFWHQRITPTNFTDPMQEKIMKWLPVIFTFFFVSFPAGLTLYWFVNNLFSIAQQYYVNKIFEAKEKLKKEQQASKKDLKKAKEND